MLDETIIAKPLVVRAKPWPSPPKPTIKAMAGFYGGFKYAELSGGNVRILGDWERDNIVLVKVKVRGPKRYRKLQLHRKVADLFEQLMDEVYEACPSYAVLQLGGFCPRHKMHDPRKGLSIHSWGAAFDINWMTNPVSRKLRTNLPPSLIQIFETAGWNWGGRWRGTKDAMHFQFTDGA